MASASFVKRKCVGLGCQKTIQVPKGTRHPRCSDCHFKMTEEQTTRELEETQGRSYEMTIKVKVRGSAWHGHGYGSIVEKQTLSLKVRAGSEYDAAQKLELVLQKLLDTESF
jgi:hypothetical protein